MRQKERIDKILSILRENGYVNVKYLSGEIGYSKATINRDLNFMEDKKLIRRSYGGVEIVENNGVALQFRYHKMKPEKKKLCKMASDMVKDGDVIFIDSSSTTEYMAPYLADKKDITVITNNMAIVTYLSDFPDIKTVCLGGEIIEKPSMLGGDLCVQNAMSYKADKFFFSTHGINEKGEMGGSGVYKLITNVMAGNSREVIYLADHSKINMVSKMVIMNLDNVDVVISDYAFSDDFKKNYKATKFIEVDLNRKRG